ncbi:hypothetical protein WICMUC_005465 [Wickerhamomyces mucosus]|uniref:G10 protein n=1 Tax=Wickerhamomyces mucosus TaxID=1378264 RepID=A0A9P8P7B7_9ASCO|nr:hypothetical protein WICMUC_005465 [Wickerhamomyces mucosus]
MPKIKSSRSRAPPDGFSKIEPTLKKFDEKLKDAQTKALNKTAGKTEGLWEIFQINHAKSRYIYELYYKKNAISKELYNYLLKSRYGDGNLIAKWKKQGYENLCCLKCIQTIENNNGGTCICRVPRSKLEEKAEGSKIKFSQCVNCGCRGCASTD